MRIRRAAALAVLTLAACDQSGSKSSQESPSPEESAEPELQWYGVAAEKFQCDSIVDPTELGAALGGTATSKESQGAPPPKNIARPCEFLVTMGAGDAGVQEVWSYDFDCRDNYEKTAETMFTQALERSADLVQGYAAEHGDKPYTTDAGVTRYPPDDAKQVDVGRRGLDHTGQAILFLDDDAPCYVRVNGPGQDRRLIVARLIAEQLNAINAPMEPYLPRKKQ